MHRLRSQEQRLAELLREYLLALISNTVTLFIFTLIGLNAPANSSPLFILIQQHRTLSVILIVVLVLYLLRVLLVGKKTDKEESNKKANQSKRRHGWSFALINAVPSVGSFFFLVTLVLVLVRPPLCPTVLCPTTQVIRIPSWHSQSIHDSNLEAFVIQVQSTSYMVPGDPTRYTADTLPKSIGVLQADGQNSIDRYHLILGLQSLLHGSYGLSIQTVGLVIANVLPLPSPLNIWYDYPLISYKKEIQGRALYFGQEAGAYMPVVFASPQGDYSEPRTGFVHLQSAGTNNVGETEQIDLHVISRVRAYIRFFVQVTYRIDNESVSHTLKLPSPFEIVFAKPTDWYLYHLQGGHLVPNS